MTAKISTFPDASTNMATADRVTGLQGGVNVNFSQAQILTGASGTYGANITLKGGNGTYGGGKTTISSGSGQYRISGYDGVLITTGAVAGSFTGNNITIKPGSAGGAGATVNLTGGSGGSGHIGGGVLITGGTPGTGDQTGGLVEVNGGVGQGAGLGGRGYFGGGASGSSSGATGGIGFLYGGDSLAADTGIGGAAKVYGGSAVATGGTGGALILGPGTGAATKGSFSLVNMTSTPGASVGTLTNAPAAGNPQTWLAVKINGVQHWMPAWHA